MTIFQSTHPADPVLLAQSWIRTLAQQPSIADPQFIADRSTGAPESVVVSLADFRTMQLYAIKALLADQRAKNPENLISLLQRPLLFSPSPLPAASPDATSSVPAGNQATLMISNYKKTINKFPLTIGSDDAVCDLVLEGLPAVAAQIGNSTLEVFVDDAKVDGKLVDKNFVVQISNGSSIALGNYQLTFFSYLFLCLFCMGFSHVTLSHPTIVDLPDHISFVIPKTYTTYTGSSGSTEALVVVVEAVTKYSEDKNFQTLKDAVVEAVASVEDPDVRQATLKLLRAKERLTSTTTTSTTTTPTTTTTNTTTTPTTTTTTKALRPSSAEVQVTRAEAKTGGQVSSLFIIIWAVKRIQRAFRSYGKRRDAKTLRELLGI